MPVDSDRAAGGRLAPRHPVRLIALVGPGLLVAATGVGAGDLLTPTIAGAALGTSILWVPPVGALLKWALNEGLARWQLATGTTLLEGWSRHLGRGVRRAFGAYLLLWSLVTGAAMINACGVAASNLLPLHAVIGGLDAVGGRIAWGVLHSLAGLALVRAGGFRRFELLLSTAVAAMFVLVVGTAAAVALESGALRSLPAPTVPPGGGARVLAVLGGVGGTVTVLSYGYWIAEHGRRGAGALATCRLDLTLCYALTGLFGAAMIVIGSQVTLTASGDDLAAELAAQIAAVTGPAGGLAFSAGLWCAVFSSLLGVWQGVPYLFADFVRLGRAPHVAPGGGTRQDGPAAGARDDGDGDGDLTRTATYRRFQLGLAIVPLALLGGTVAGIQLTYAVCGALFMPFLALTLLVLNNRSGLVGARFRNRAAANALLVATLLLFAVLGARTIATELAPG